MNTFVLFILWGLIFLAQISIAPIFVFRGVSPDFIYAFFIASFLFLKNKKLIFGSALAAGIFAAFSSLLPAPAHIFVFFVLAAALFFPEKLLAENAKAPLILAGVFPLSFARAVLLSVFTRVALFLGAGAFSIANFENTFSRAALSEAFLNLASVLIFYFIIRFIIRFISKRE